MNNETRTTKEKLLERIETEAVNPRPRVYFILKNIGMWMLAAASVLVGSLAVSSIIFRVANVPSILPPGARPLPLPDIIHFLPFIWIALFGLFAYLAYREIRSTKKGYKYDLSILLLVLALATCILGTAFYATGTGLFLDRLAARHVPFHRDMELLQRDRWMNPENGFLVGEVTSVGDTGLQIIDPAQTPWNVTFGEEVPAEKRASVAAGERIGLRGEVTDAQGHEFRACDVRSLEFQGDTRRPMPPPERMNADPRNSKCGDVRPLD